MTQLPAVGDFNYTVDVTVGNIDFTNYNELLAQATTLADWLSQVKLDEDNLAEGKKLVAKVRKKVNELKDYRLGIKRAYDQPLNDFTDRINTISQVVEQAEDTVRRQIRELEEIRREEKRGEIRRIWDLRSAQYPEIPDGAMDFEVFMQNKYLNKTYAMSAVETEMVDYMERFKKDLAFIERLNGSGDGESAAEVYKKAGYDITNIEIPVAQPRESGDEFYIKVFTETHWLEACSLLNRNGIDFEKFRMQRGAEILGKRING